jgi:hypothetical protein
MKRTPFNNPPYPPRKSIWKLVAIPLILIPLAFAIMWLWEIDKNEVTLPQWMAGWVLILVAFEIRYALKGGGR